MLYSGIPARTKIPLWCIWVIQREFTQFLYAVPWTAIFRRMLPLHFLPSDIMPLMLIPWSYSTKLRILVYATNSTSMIQFSLYWDSVIEIRRCRYKLACVIILPSSSYNGLNRIQKFVIAMVWEGDSYVADGLLADWIFSGILLPMVACIQFYYAKFASLNYNATCKWKNVYSASAQLIIIYVYLTVRL